MKLIRVGAAALNQTPMDWDANAANIAAAIREARSRGVGLLCLPEMCVCGYGCEDAFMAPSLRRTAREILKELIGETRGIAVALGLPWMHEGALFNVCALAVDGRLTGLAAKQHLAGEGLHYEPRWFKPWPAGATAVVNFEGEDLPLGDPVFDLDGIRVGFEICEDAWVARRIGSTLADRGVDVICNPSASHFAFNKMITRRRLVAEGSRAFGVAYVYSNLVGNEAGRAIYDGGVLIGSSGVIVASGPRFDYRLHSVTDAVVDVDANRLRRAQVTGRVPDLSGDQGLIPVAFGWQPCQATGDFETRPSWEVSDDLREEEFARAIALALFDYARKSRSKGSVVSLSGGADSAAVACLVRLMVDLSAAQIGCEEVCRRLRIDHRSDASGITRILLTTVYQATRNSSAGTRAAAEHLAEGIGARHLELDVDDLCQSYVRLIEDALGRRLTWTNDDVALQNIQARVRAPSAWLLANLGGALLLSTSNRSEAAVGYATMDGDTCGGISPIAGIDKAFLRRWLLWLERQGPDGRGPIPELAGVNALRPTAELRPLDRKQTDEEDLMPYDLLDAIEDEAIGQKRSPAEALASISARFPQFERGDLTHWIERFFTLWARNQWKRERYAPSFHVDDKNLDPKTWCRFPILSGGFRRELRQIREPGDGS